MTSQLRRRIWARLGLVALLLAAVVGASVLLIGRASTSWRVHELATEEAQALVEHARALTHAGTGEDRLRREIADHLMQEHVAHGPFVLIELYDRSRHKLLDVAGPRFAPVLRAVESRQHGALLRDTVEQEEISVGGSPFLQVFAPLKGPEGTVAYFEGVYRVDRDLVATLNRGVALSVVLVVIVVLAAVAVLHPLIVRLNAELLRTTDDLSHANMGLLVALGSAVAKRDSGTNSHNYRVTLYAARLAEAVGQGPDGIRGLIKGAFLHDVGKIAVVDAVLRKPGPLTADEAATMKTHVVHGVEIVSKFRWLDDALDVVQCHHEQYDGSGYPAGLRGDAIPVAARIFAIVDVFDALTTRRPYKDAAPLHVALQTLLAGRGRAFDPALLDRFVALAPELHRTVCGATDAELAVLLDRMLVRYFSHEERRPRGGAGSAPGPQADQAGAGTLSLSDALWVDAEAQVQTVQAERRAGRAGAGETRGRSWLGALRPRVLATARPR